MHFPEDEHTSQAFVVTSKILGSAHTCSEKDTIVCILFLAMLCGTNSMYVTICRGLCLLKHRSQQLRFGDAGRFENDVIVPDAAHKRGPLLEDDERPRMHRLLYTGSTACIATLPKCRVLTVANSYSESVSLLADGKSCHHSVFGPLSKFCPGSAGIGRRTRRAPPWR